MTFAVTTRSVPGPGLLAEAVTFDPGVVVAVLLVFAFVCIAGAAVVAVGVSAGYRCGRDPDRERAATAWRVCVALEVLAVVTAIATWAPTQVHLVVWAALGSSVAAHVAGRAGRDAET